MAKLIENKASITYNDNYEDKTCPVPTVVYKYGKRIHKMAATSESGLIVPEKPAEGAAISSVTATGDIGEDGIANYILEVFNPLPETMYNIEIKDKLNGLPAGSKLISHSKVVDKDGNSLFAFDAATGELTIGKIEKLETDEMLRFHFQIKVPEGTPQNTKITDQATMTHQIDNPDYNPNEEDPGPQFLDGPEIKSETIELKVNSADVEATKEAPENVIAGEVFDYNLEFTNDGNKDATVNKITDDLPEGFTLEPPVGAANPVLTIGGTPVDTGAYTVKIDDNQLVITPTAEDSIIIPKGQTLSVVVSGKMTA